MSRRRPRRKAKPLAATTRAVDWVDSARLWWLGRDKHALAFSFMLGLIVLGVGVMVYRTAVAEYEERHLHCLALNIYHEARGEPEAGQIAVGEVTMNRVRSKYYPDDVCEVVFEKRWDRLRNRYVGAFSWTELDRKSAVDVAAWKRAWAVAETVYYNSQDPLVKDALFYHARYIQPSWARKKEQIASIGQHVFYK